MVINSELNELMIRRMTRQDFPLMVRWLNDPAVLEFFDEPPTNIDRVIQKYGPRVDGNHYVTPWIIEYSNTPIGYIQHYEIQKQQLITYGYDENEKIYGIDQFIGETDYWGKGFGTKAIELMLNYLCKRGAEKVVLEVKNNNSRAISSYKKCGFQQIKELQNNLVLMEWVADVHVK